STVITFFITTPVLSVITIVSFVFVTLVGVWLSLRSRVRLNHIREHEDEIRERQRDLLTSTPELQKFFGDLLHQEESHKG
ncbi:MAG: hypothetical protein ACXACA_04355, partial [Candidatus Ranarchaeia archaeon]